MTPSEKEKIIKEGFDAIRKVYNLRDDLLEDAGKLEAAKESNRKLSDRVANLEVTIKTLNAAIDKKDVEIKRLKEELEAEKKIHCCDKCVCSVKKEYELLRKAHTKLCCDYNSLCENRAKLEDNFHELREKFGDLFFYYAHGTLKIKDVMAFADWFKDTLGDFGVYDDEEE